MIFVVALTVSAALVVGAAWGIFGPLHERVEGFLLAVAGGALIVALMDKMIGPALAHLPMIQVAGFVGLGAAAFSILDYLIDEMWDADTGGGLLVAITLDGVPENLALGVALIGAGFGDVAALAGAIFLSNLPEAAGGAKQMVRAGFGRAHVFGLWLATAGLLCGAALVGYWLLADLPMPFLSQIRCFSAGAVVASLATEIFPRAFREGHHLAGLAVAIGLVAAIAIG